VGSHLVTTPAPVPGGTFVPIEDAMGAWYGCVWVPYTMRPVEIRTHVCRRGRLWRKRARAKPVGGNPPL
jgi:hypothetical protein